jgi:hypothetical protein
MLPRFTTLEVGGERPDHDIVALYFESHDKKGQKITSLRAANF